MIEVTTLLDALSRSTLYWDDEWENSSSAPRWAKHLFARLRYLVNDERILYATSDLGREDFGNELSIWKIAIVTPTTFVLGQIDLESGPDVAGVTVHGFGRSALKELIVEEARFNAQSALPTRLRVRLEFDTGKSVELPISKSFVPGAIAGLIELTESLKANLNNR